MTALRHLLRRLLWAGVVIVGVVTIAFVIERGLPGDPVRMLLGPQARPADVTRAREVYALDEPVWTQYLQFWTRLLHGAPERAPEGEHASCVTIADGALHVDLGFSYRYRKPVAELIAEKAPLSAQLALAALLVQAVLGLSIGVASGRTKGSLWDQLAIGTTLVGTSTPIFALGLALQYLFAFELGLLPHDGYGDTASEQLRSLVLPALTLGLYGAALYARMAREETSRALSEAYVTTARAKGVPEWRVLVVHAMRNAVLPIATLMVLELGALVGGAVVTEKLFRWPGMGSMVVDALVNRDGPVVVGTVLFSAGVIVAASLLVDVMTVLVDPRLRRRAPASA